MSARDRRRWVLESVADACAGAFAPEVVHDLNPAGDLIYWGPLTAPGNDASLGPLLIVRLHADLVRALDALDGDSLARAVSRAVLHLSARVRTAAASRHTEHPAHLVTGGIELLDS